MKLANMYTDKRTSKEFEKVIDQFLSDIKPELLKFMCNFDDVPSCSVAAMVVSNAVHLSALVTSTLEGIKNEQKGN